MAKDRSVIDEIKRKLTIKWVIDKVGGAELFGDGDKLVGWHMAHESTSRSSLHVDNKNGIYHCFNCGQGGDIFSWFGHQRWSSCYSDRNSDMFTEGLRELAALAGVVLPEYNAEAAAERRSIEGIWQIAADFYHKALTAEHRQFLHTRYGLTNETIDGLKIGYAPARPTGLLSHLIKEHSIDSEELVKSGLFHKFDKGGISDLFQGRLIFPYWRGGRVCYFIGRMTDASPQWEREGGMKYKKLLVYNSKHPYVSEQVSNSYFYGEDAARGADELFVTEGVTDCIIANQYGFPCISPVTVQFRKDDCPRLLDLGANVKTLYLVNDNEDNDAGKKGALATAEMLWTHGHRAKMVTLPKADGVDKVDLNDFLREQGADAFRAILATSKTLLDLYIEAVADAKTDDERIEARRAVIKLIAYLDDTHVQSNLREKMPAKLGIGKQDYNRLVKEAIAELKQAEAQTAAGKAKRTASELPQKLKTWPYDVQEGCIGNWRVFTDDETGEEKEAFSPLCNFDVRIVADVAADDGEEISRKIAIAGLLNTGLPLPEIEIDADEFEFMKWPVAKWGSRVSIEPFKGAASLLRHAIQKLSADTMTDRRTFTHTGWRVLDGKRVFLDAEGAIGAEGVSVKLPQNLKNYVFPRDNAISAKAAMRASVDLLDIAPAKVSSPLYAAIWAAPLSEIIPSVFTPSMNGGSGSLKSSLSAVHLNHFGAKFTEYAMPADWLATTNSLEKLTFHAKDIPLIIDDFRPSTNPAESRMLQEAVSRITRAVGNRQGRSRLDSSSEFKRTYAPRGVVMMTAERNATGKSTTSRILTIDVEPGDINSSLLTVAQKQRHVYSYAMRGYIESIARDYDELAKMLPARVADLRTRNDNGHHKRLPNATAILYVAFECAMSYAVEVEAITKEEAKRRCDDCYAALKGIEQIQSEATEAEDPAIKYITILASLIAQDKAHLVGKGKNVASLGMSLSEKLGWYNADNVYLLPGAYNAVCRYAMVEGWSFPSDENTLRKELDRQGWLTKHDPNRHTTAQRPPGSKSIERVTVISYEKFATVLVDMGFEFPKPPVTPLS